MPIHNATSTAARTVAKAARMIFMVPVLSKNIRHHTRAAFNKSTHHTREKRDQFLALLGAQIIPRPQMEQ